MESTITKEIVFSYFAGTSSALQKKLVETWVKETDNRELFFLYLYEWERKNVQYDIDVNAGLERHRAWVQSLKAGNEVTVSEVKAIRFPRLRKWMVAASVTLATLSGGWLLKDTIMYRAYKTSFGEIQKVTLPDGSKVVLNANSVLTVPRFGFQEDLREVYLNGEASFDVVHVKNHGRFLVRTMNELNIEVLGTEFNVYSRKSGSKVVLQRGKVRLNYKQGEQSKAVTMKPGDLATMDNKGALQVRYTEQPHQYSAWKFHRFIFDDITFREIANRLEEVFGTKVIIQDKDLANLLISGSFTALDAEELLDILSEAQEFSYTKKGEEIIITHTKE